MNDPIWGPMPPQQQIIIQPRKRVPHGMHLILTLATCGLWSPVWVVDALVRGRN